MLFCSLFLDFLANICSISLFQTPACLPKARTAHQSQLHHVVAWWDDLADWRCTVHDDAHLMGRDAAAEPEHSPPCCQRRGVGLHAPGPADRPIRWRVCGPLAQTTDDAYHGCTPG